MVYCLKEYKLKEVNYKMKSCSAQRLFLIDNVKLLAAYFVVFIHCTFPGELGIAIKAVARFAVPFFFLCSGYFLYGNTFEIIRKKAGRILKLFIYTTLFYVLFDIGLLTMKHDISGIVAYLHRFTDLEAILRFLLFNVPFVSTHLWYLLAMFYVYCIYYFFRKINVSDAFIQCSAIGLLISHLVLWHVAITFNITNQTFFVRNFIFVGYPFVGIGLMFRKYQNKIPRLKKEVMYTFLAIGYICSIMSRFSFGNKSVPLGAIITASTLFILCITTKPSQRMKIPNAAIYSTYIYLFHPLIQSIYFLFIAKIDISNQLFTNSAPIFVCFASTIFAVAYAELQQKLFEK